MFRGITIAIICISVVGWIAWDIWVVFFNRERRDSISEAIRDAGSFVGTIPFALGVLNGHFFWPGYPVLGQPDSAILLGSIGAALAVGTGLARLWVRIPHWVMMVWVLLVITLGHYLWPLEPVVDGAPILAPAEVADVE